MLSRKWGTSDKTHDWEWRLGVSGSPGGNCLGAPTNNLIHNHRPDYSILSYKSQVGLLVKVGRIHILINDQHKRWLW